MGLENSAAAIGSISISILPSSSEASGTRRRILEAALRLFAERGYHGVSVRDVAGEVGVKAASLYSHFTSKEQILAELLELGHAEFLAELRTAAREPDGSPVERLGVLVDAHVRGHATYPLLARVCADDIRGLSSESLERTLAARIEVIGLFCAAIDHGVEAGEFDDVDSFLAAMGILAMGMRVANWYSGNAAGLEFAAVLPEDQVPTNSYSVDQLCARYRDLALRMVTRRER